MKNSHYNTGTVCSLEIQIPTLLRDWFPKGVHFNWVCCCLLYDSCVVQLQSYSYQTVGAELFYLFLVTG